MVSTVKVSNITTPDGTGNVTFDRPLSGSGASLTSLPAANLTGTLPAISGASLTNLPSGLTLGTTVATTSGTTIDFTGIPTGTKSIDLILSNVSSNGGGVYGVVIGDSGGFETSGYLCSCVIHSSGAGAATADSTADFRLQHANIAGASASESGFLSLRLVNAATFTWVAAGQTVNMLNAALNNYATNSTVGTKSLSAELTQIRLFNSAGNTWDAGEINIQYQ